MAVLTPEAYLSISWVFAGLTILPIVARAAVLYKRTGKCYAPDYSDIGIYGLLFCTLVINSTDTWWMAKTIEARKLPPQTLLPGFETPIHTTITIGKIQFSDRVFYHLALWSIKGTFLAIYFSMRRNFPPKLKAFLYATTIFVILSFVANELLIVLWCRPITLWWTTELWKRCSTSSTIAPIIVSVVSNIVGDMLLIMLPLLLFRKMQLRKSQIYAGAFVVFLGISTITMSLVRLVVTIKTITTPGDQRVVFTYQYVSFVLTEAEGVVIGWAGCMPALRVLLLRKKEVAPIHGRRDYVFSMNKSKKRSPRAPSQIGLSELETGTLTEHERED